MSCANYFLFTCSSESEREFYYWLLFGLWRTKSFHPFLKGSLIPFITIDDMKKCIQAGDSEAKKDLAKYKKNVEVLKFLDLKEKQFHRNLKLIENARKLIFLKYRRRQF